MDRQGGCEGGGDPRRDYFNELAPAWDDHGPDPQQTLRRMGELLGMLHLAAEQDLLEVGCGTGQITALLREAVRPGRVVSIDFAEGMVEHARRRIPDGDFRVADVCSTDLGEGAFDVVLCFHAFPHFRDQPGAIANMARALKAGGRLIVMHLAGSEVINARHGSIGGAVGCDHLPAGPEWEDLVQPAGLEVVEAIDREDLFLVVARKEA